MKNLFPYLLLVCVTIIILYSILSFVDLAQHYLVKAGISVLRRLKKTDNNRIARYERYVYIISACDL